MIKTWKERIKPEYHSVDRFAMAGMQAEIDELRSENARLRDALKKANDQAESFERLWYLRGYALEAAIEALDWLPTCERITCRCNSLWDRQQKAIEAARAALGEKS